RPSAATCTVGWKFACTGAGSAQRTACDQNCGASGHCVQALAQPCWACEVHATTRPRRYCQWARSGCPCWVSSAVTARSLRVVATYPDRDGKSPEIDLRIGLGSPTTAAT